MNTFNKSDHNDSFDGTIDLIELFKAIWAGKILIISFFTIASIISVLYALSLPNKYQSTVLIVPAESSAMDSTISKYGGLASLAGVSIPKTSNKASIGIEVLKSKLFIEKFITERDILVPLMAASSWDEYNNELVINPKIYDSTNKIWTRKVEAPKKPEPSSLQAYEYWMTNTFSVAEDRKTSFIRVTINHFSPSLSQKWASWLIEDLNNFMRETDVKEAELAIEYLNYEADKTSSEELRALFYMLIQSETEKKMLAYSRDEYLYRVIDPPVIPEEKFSPTRSTICIVGALLGGILGVLFVVFRYYFYLFKRDSRL